LGELKEATVKMKMPPMKLYGGVAPWAAEKYLDNVFEMLDAKKKNRESKVESVDAEGRGSKDKDSGQNTFIDK